MSFIRSLSDHRAAARCLTLAQLAPRGAWQLALLHERAQHLLIWTTKGQGRVTVEGVRRGVSVHNAIFVPAGTLFSYEIGAQGFGLALEVPASLPLGLPGEAHHLRLRDNMAQAEITAILEAMQREQSRGDPLAAEAQAAHAALASVWLRRRIEARPARATAQDATERLAQDYCRRVAADFRSGRLPGDYAAELGVATRELERACRESAGRDAGAILTERVLHEARSMLARPGIDAADAAERLGFAGPGYFERFLAYHGGRAPRPARRATVSA
ncbi:AraC family transcriptional regulator [Rhodosalinus sediminis]|uniref:AraC family transcriptional regulator n=1 Tax=Rhodosalinus sediminis TaxID=1940533 RepID=UPI002356EB95|nr:AraC family transcriptional regulator [Rhodosalinus sediminis]